MKVILLKDIAKLGKRGEVKEVADGYAINVLIRKGDALQATPGELSKWKAKEDAKQHKKELETSAFARLIEALRHTSLCVSNKKHDEKGQLFAQVKEHDIADVIFSTVNVSIDPKQIILEHPIKTIGIHHFEIKHGGTREKIALVVQ
jgi:large subunit ribosomal protein L9